MKNRSELGLSLVIILIKTYFNRVAKFIKYVGERKYAIAKYLIN